MLAANAALYRQYGQDTCYGATASIGKTPVPEDRITLIKDSLTTGQSLAQHLTELADTGTKVTDIFVSVDRMEGSSLSGLTARRELEKAFGVRIHAIVTLEDIIRAMKDGVISGREHLDALVQYKTRYGGNSHGD